MPNPARRQQPAPPLDAEAVLAWYDAHARILPWRVGPADRAHGLRPDPYRVWLSEVMLQQTTVAAVAKYYARFLELWPTVHALAAAPLDAVLVEWAGLGYYARARNLHAGARMIVDRYEGRFPLDPDALSGIPGIGPYTLSAVSAICADRPVAVVDGNVERVMARYLALDRPVREAKSLIRNAVQNSVPTRAGDFAQALMDLGATVCAPRAALCVRCPLAPRCAGRSDPLRYPIKPEKAARPTRYGHAYVIRDATGDVYLERRPATGLLARMTGTPTSDWHGAAAPPAFPAAATDWQRSGQVVHVFTHFRLELEVWAGRATDPKAFAEGWWSAPGDLAAEALPTLFRKVLAAALG